MTSLPCFFTIQKSLLNFFFSHKFFICLPIFKIFAAHFTTNLVLNTVYQIFLPTSKETISYPRKFILKWQNQDISVNLCGGSLKVYLLINATCIKVLNKDQFSVFSCVSFIDRLGCNQMLSICMTSK